MAIKNIFKEVGELKADIENLDVDALKAELAADPDLLEVSLELLVAQTPFGPKAPVDGQRGPPLGVSAVGVRSSRYPSRSITH